LTSSARRGLAQQYPERRRERLLRGRIVDLRHWTEELGWKRHQTALLLQLSLRTLRQWEHDFDPHDRRLLDVPLGRPTLHAPPQQRNQVVALVDEFGSALGVAWLRQAFPDMARAELEDILRRYRRLWRRRQSQPLRILHWQVPGSIWAADFTQAPQPIDGIYPYLLAVRDLASGYQLLWQPVMHADSAAVQDALASLFALDGAPLVLKTDNGSPFAAALSSLAAPTSPLALFSPPYTPTYNGSIEAGIGSLKTRTQAHAARHGRTKYWTVDDVVAAQCEANTTSHPKGPSAPTPQQVWHTRRPIMPEQRALFQTAVDHCRAVIRSELNPTESLDERVLNVHEQRAMDRQAIRRALEEHGYLLYSRRRIPLPFKKRKVANIR
jgi:hypothetical protein